MHRLLNKLDRRWVFLAMLLAVAVPLLAEVTFPESPSPKVMRVFETIEALPEGSRVLLSLDYDPASEGELAPMSAAFVRHCCERGHRLYFMTLWERAPAIVARHVNLIRQEYPRYRYGEEFVDLGYKAGERGAIKIAMSDWRRDFSTDAAGTSLDRIPMTADLKSLQEMDLLVIVGSGSPGPQEWVQYAAAQYNLPMVCGSPGVQAPQLYPYIPKPLNGMLGAIKDAAEYEQALLNAYPGLAERTGAREGLRRMGPQLVAHLLMVGLIVLGNVIYWSERRGVRSGR